jgi:hypothetical protein
MHNDGKAGNHYSGKLAKLKMGPHALLPISQGAPQITSTRIHGLLRELRETMKILNIISIFRRVLQQKINFKKLRRIFDKLKASSASITSHHSI